MKLMEIKRISKKAIAIPMNYRMELASLLIKSGADPLKKDLFDESALDRAKKNNFAELIHLLSSQ